MEKTGPPRAGGQERIGYAWDDGRGTEIVVTPTDFEKDGREYSLGWRC